MTSSIVLSASLLLTIITTTQSFIYNQNYGPFFYPNGSRNDSVFMTMGAHNTTHFYLNLHVTGNHWFGFALPDDCTPNSGCTGSLRPSGCVTPNTAISGCKMAQSDAIIFGNYGGTVMVTALEWTLGNHSRGFLHRNQNSIGIYYQESFALIDTYYNAYILRPYDPSKYGDRSSHKITYPFTGSFCWLWAIGKGLYYGPDSSHTYAGYQCIDFGGTTDAPTPSPTYLPTYKPTINPTLKPTKIPSIDGETAQPTPDPTKEPTVSPTEVSKSPTVPPTSKPTPGPTVRQGEPTNAPTKKPTPSPSQDPTVSPTPEPTDAPLEPGQTKSPSIDPTSSPTTHEPTPGPTYKPTPSPTFKDVIDDMDIEAISSTDNSWLEENLTWILAGGVIAVILCFCSACLCFWCMQKRRSQKRRERRLNLLKAERFKIEQGLNIDAENRTKTNRAIAKRMAAKYKKRSGTGTTESGTRSASGLRYGYGDDGGSTTDESDEFFIDDLEYGRIHNKYRSRTDKSIDHDSDDEKAEIYVTPGHTQGGRNLKGNGGYGALRAGGRKKKYKPVGRGRRDKGKIEKARKSKFTEHSLDGDENTSAPRTNARMKQNRNVISSSDSSD